jgi:hypothetical protein
LPDVVRPIVDAHGPTIASVLDAGQILVERATTAAAKKKDGAP